jgi:MFS transporter, UMF1 family
MAAVATPELSGRYPADERIYRQRIRAWTLYDWANSAFVTTVLAALLPVYYSSVAGATLPSEATATGYWSITLSISLFISALISPLLGTVSDVIRGKKRFLAIFVGIGVLGSGLLIFINTGDWFLASLFLIIGRIGFGGSIVFYDALLPHVAKPADQDRVSTRGYAFGYLGGGILLAINVVMVQLLPEDNLGIRLSFLSVAAWWLVFSIPIFRTVPEPQADSADLQPGETVVSVSFKRIRATFGDLRQYSELFKFLIAFLIYNDAIGTIIGLAAIYGAELGFGTLELVLALLLVQFVGIPFSLIFGSLPARSGNPQRHRYLAFIVFNAVALPVVSIIGTATLPADLIGNEPAPFTTQDAFVGEGSYSVVDLDNGGGWQTLTVSGQQQIGTGAIATITAALSGIPDDVDYLVSEDAGALLSMPLNGETLRITYSVGPDNGLLAFEVDGEALTQTVIAEDGSEFQERVIIDTYNDFPRYNERTTLTLPAAGQQTLTLLNLGEASIAGNGTRIEVASIEVLSPVRQNNLPVILGALLAVQAVGLAFAFAFGNAFKGLADRLDTRRSILLALVIYAVIATLGFILTSTLQFWFLAWMVAIVQGGSQALSRSLYASLMPSSKSGEFFGFYSIMEKFASILGPLLFAGAVVAFGSSRPAILSLIALFVVGGYLLTRVDIAAGQQRAREEDAAIMGANG